MLLISLLAAHFAFHVIFSHANGTCHIFREVFHQLNVFFEILILCCTDHLQQLVIYETSASELDIIRDISRTFPSHVFFQQRHGPGQRSLYNVLKAYSVYDRDVGYVQVGCKIFIT